MTYGLLAVPVPLTTPFAGVNPLFPTISMLECPINATALGTIGLKKTNDVRSNATGMIMLTIFLRRVPIINKQQSPDIPASI